MESEKSLTVFMACHVRWYNAEAYYAMTMARLLAARGHRVIVSVHPQSPLESHVRSLENIEVYTHDFLAKTPLRLATMLYRYRRLLSEIGPDIVTVHRSESHFWTVAALHGLSPRPPLIRFRGDPRAPKSSFLNRWLYGRASNHVILSGNHLRIMLQWHLNLPDDHVGVIHAPVDTVRFHPRFDGPEARREWGIGENVPLLGVVGRIGRIKGHHFFLDMLQELPERYDSTRAFFAYHEEHDGVVALKREVEKRGLADRITFIGPSKNIECLIALADIGVISSIGSEANCRAALEFMSCGKPLVATTVGVIPEVVINGECGYLVPPANPEEAANRVCRLLDDDIERHRMGENGRKRVETFFSESVFASRICDLLTKTVDDEID